MLSKHNYTILIYFLYMKYDFFNRITTSRTLRNLWCLDPSLFIPYYKINFLVISDPPPCNYQIEPLLFGYEKCIIRRSYHVQQKHYLVIFWLATAKFKFLWTCAKKLKVKLQSWLSIYSMFWQQLLILTYFIYFSKSL